MTSYLIRAPKDTPREFAWDFGESAQTLMRQTISELYSQDKSEIDDLMNGLGLARSLALNHESHGDAKVIRERLTALKAAFAGLTNAMKILGVHEIEALSDLICEEETDEKLAAYDKSSNPELSGVYGVSLHELRNQMAVIEAAIDNALAQIKVPRGAPPKVEPKLLAFFMREALQVRGIRTTAYDSGIYFRLLAAAFEDAFPELGESAYRRHGAWALKVNDAYDFVELQTKDDKDLDT